MNLKREKREKIKKEKCNYQLRVVLVKYIHIDFLFFVSKKLINTLIKLYILNALFISNSRLRI